MPAKLCAVLVWAVLVWAVLVWAVLVCAVLVCAVLVWAVLVCAVLVCAVLVCAESCLFCKYCTCKKMNLSAKPFYEGPRWVGFFLSMILLTGLNGFAERFVTAEIFEYEV